MADQSDVAVTPSQTPAPISRRFLAGVYDALIVGALYTLVESGLIIVLMFFGAGGLFLMLMQDWLNTPKLLGVLFLTGVLEGLSSLSAVISVWLLGQFGSLIQINSVLAFINHPIGRLVALVFPLCAVNWLYHAGMESSSKRGTIGKTVLGLAVTDKAGKRIGFGQSTIRHLMKSVSTAILGIGYIMAPLCKTRQTLHDKISGCIVVNTRP